MSFVGRLLARSGSGAGAGRLSAAVRPPFAPVEQGVGQGPGTELGMQEQWVEAEPNQRESTRNEPTRVASRGSRMQPSQVVPAAHGPAAESVAGSPRVATRNVAAARSESRAPAVSPTSPAETGSVQTQPRAVAAGSHTREFVHHTHTREVVHHEHTVEHRVEHDVASLRGETSVVAAERPAARVRAALPPLPFALDRPAVVVAPPPVHVHIGRIVVTADPPPAPVRRPAVATRPAAKTLAEHLSERGSDRGSARGQDRGRGGR